MNCGSHHLYSKVAHYPTPPKKRACHSNWVGEFSVQHIARFGIESGGGGGVAVGVLPRQTATDWSFPCAMDDENPS